MKLYTVQYVADDADKSAVTTWCASIADATKAYNDAQTLKPAINIVTLPKGREEMAAWLNERAVKV